MFKQFLEIPLPGQWWTVLMLVWVIFWKGLALWRSGRLGQKWWFVALLLLNTFGILEIFYIYVFSKKQDAASRNPGRRESDDHDGHHKAHATGVSAIMQDAEPVATDDVTAPVQPSTEPMTEPDEKKSPENAS